MKQLNSSENKKSSQSELNKVEDHFDRGLDFMLRGGVQQRKQVPEGGRLMNLDIILVSALPVAFLLFLVGGLIGWVARDYMMNYREVPRPHPEMFDTNGNLVPDEIVAFRFENNYAYDYEEEDDD